MLFWLGHVLIKDEKRIKSLCCIASLSLTNETMVVQDKTMFLGHMQTWHKMLECKNWWSELLQNDRGNWRSTTNKIERKGNNHTLINWSGQKKNY